MTRPGFTLIELLVFFAIAALISVSLFQGWFQTNKIFQISTDMIAIDKRILLVQDRLEKDITGAFIPVYMPSKKTGEKEELKREESKQPEKEPKKEKKDHVIKKAFFSSRTGKNLKELTCITTNPVATYGKAKPHMARVLYRLKKEKGREGYALVRKESTDISYDALVKASDVSEYVIADGIKSLTIEFESLPEKAKAEEWVTSHEWDSDKRSKTKEKNRVLLPQLATITIELIHARDQVLEYSFIFPIAADEDPHPAKETMTPERKRGVAEVSSDNTFHMARALDGYKEYKWRKTQAKNDR